MFTGSDRLEANKRNLHAQYETQDVECGVGGEDSVGVASHDEQTEHV